MALINSTKVEPPDNDKNSAGEHSSPGQERSYVAAILDDNHLIEDAITDDLGMITVLEYRHILGLIFQLYQEKWTSIDRHTILNLAEKSPRVANALIEMGGIEALERICSNQMSVKNFEKNRIELKQLFGKRQLILGMCERVEEIKKNAASLELDELVKLAEDSVMEVSSRVYSVNDYIVVGEDPDTYITNSENELALGITFKGVMTNMAPYDEMFGGFGNGRLHVFGAPTGCGKSLLSVNMSLSCAYGMLLTDPRYKVCVIDTGELMYKGDWFPRLIAADSGVRTKSIQKNWYVRNDGEREAVRESMRKINDDKRIIWKTMPDFDGPSVRSCIRRAVKREGVNVIFFDNIKINPRWEEGQGVYNKLGDLAQYMKDAAMELEIPVVAFIQLTSDGTVTGRRKLGMTEPHVSMFAGGQRILHNTDVGGVLDWEDYEDPGNDNRKLIVQKARNDRSHRPGEYMRCIGDLRRSKLVVIENILKTPLDNDSSGVNPSHVRMLELPSGLPANEDLIMPGDLPFEVNRPIDLDNPEPKKTKLDRF
jgi:replicative DNA helicase